MTAEQAPDLTPAGMAEVQTATDLARLLRQLRRREARQRGDSEWTYRELAAKTGWSLGSISQYLDGKALPPTDRFDALVRLLGATPAEQGALATARDRVEDSRRRGGSTATGTARLLPRQLPVTVPAFSGRAGELGELDALREAAANPVSMVIATVSGTAGVGKTAFVVHWAHRAAAGFPDGQLYVDLRGFDPGGQVMDPAEAIRRFLDALGVPAERIPKDPDAQAALYRSRLAGQRLLIVLDNARDSAQVRPLLPGTSTCLVVITSRNQLTGLVAAEGAHSITLSPLHPEEARELLTRRLGAQRTAAEPEAVDEVILACARLPLALVIVAARAVTQPQLRLGALARDLYDARGQHRLGALTTDDPRVDLRTVFSWSYRALTAGAARLFRQLGLHPGPDVSTAAAASLAALPASRARALLRELTEAHLLVEHLPGRYTFHDLLRSYATELAGAIDSRRQRRAATRRIVDHLLHSAHAASYLIDPTRDPVTLAAPSSGAEPERPTDYQDALAWFTAERPVLVATVRYAGASGLDVQTWQLAWALATFLDRQAHWRDWITTQRLAVAAARVSGHAVQGRAHRNLARAHIRLGQLDDAYTGLKRALDLDRRAADLTGQAHDHRNLAMLWNQKGDHTTALGHARQALELYEAGAHLPGQADALNALGWLYEQLGDHDRAIDCCERALAHYDKIDDPVGQADTLDSLGYVHHQLGNQASAIAYYQRAADLLRELDVAHLEAFSLINLGNTFEVAGDIAAARAAWRRALTILDRLDHPDSAQLRAKLAAPGTGAR